MQIFRIADIRHPVWDGTGAMLIGGRFNSPGRPVIYGARSYAGAMLEVLVHARIGKLPRHQVCVVATVPDDIAVELASLAVLPPGWDTLDEPVVSRAFGDKWLAEARTAVLMVPSVIARVEWNVLVNPAHPDAARIVVSEPEAVLWDERLFRKQAVPRRRAGVRWQPVDAPAPRHAMLARAVPAMHSQGPMHRHGRLASAAASASSAHRLGSVGASGGASVGTIRRPGSAPIQN